MELIAAVIKREKKEKFTGSLPTFWTENEEETQRVALLLAKIFKAMVHDMENGIYLIVRHG